LAEGFEHLCGIGPSRGSGGKTASNEVSQDVAFQTTRKQVLQHNPESEYVSATVALPALVQRTILDCKKAGTLLALHKRAIEVGQDGHESRLLVPVEEMST
jgi:hypothetical protein